MRLIDAEALKKAFAEYGEKAKFTQGSCQQLIDNATTVEVPENAVNCVLTMFGKCSYNETGCSDCEIKDKIRKALNERPQGEWIPVSERLPQDRDWYLGVFREPDTGYIIDLPFVCDYVGEATKGTTKDGWILRGLTDIDNPSKYYKNLECVAWQSLPEPYKKGGSE